MSQDKEAIVPLDDRQGNRAAINLLHSLVVMSKKPPLGSMTMWGVMGPDGKVEHIMSSMNLAWDGLLIATGLGLTSEMMRRKGYRTVEVLVTVIES